MDDDLAAWLARIPTLGVALEEARRTKHAHVGVEHVFVALADSAEGKRMMQQLGIDPSALADNVRRATGTGGGAAESLCLTSRLQRVLRHASAEAGAGSISEGALMVSILEEGASLPARYLASIGHQPASMLARLKQPSVSDADGTRLSPGVGGVAGDGTRLSMAAVPQAARAQQPLHAAAPGPRVIPDSSVPVTLPTPTLDKFGRDLTKLARLGKLKEAVGRDAEITQVVVVLARTQKANPLLLGEAGVGKTAIVEGLAWRIVHREVPPVLHGRRVVELDMASLTAGTSLRGQFEERIQQVVREATEAPDVILFIDEIHTVVGAGASSGSNDAAQMLKPALARGDVSCIGATTEDEYSRFIRKDAALERRFSPVMVNELSPVACLDVLRKIAPRIVERQSSHGQELTIFPDALRAAVDLTNRYVKNRQQPDKCIDAIDLACAKAVVAGRSTVAAGDVADVVSEWTGVPARQLSAADQRRYADMEKDIAACVIGQDQAVAAVSRAVRTALAGMKAPNRPVGVFLFLGPSGVGKTQLAKELARFLFGTHEALIRFDMSEYQDKHALTNLMGAARGYQDSERGGQLPEALRRRPYSVVLLDEIEKAHPDIFNVFLAAFDDGRVTDNLGRTIDCTNVVFILTSNLGAYESEPSVMGFLRSGAQRLRDRAARFLRPELVNRITEVIEFRALGATDLERILDLVLAQRIRSFASAQGITLRADPSARVLLVQHGYDPKMGARPLERAVEQWLVQPVVELTFARSLSGCEVVAFAEADRIAFRVDGEKVS